MPFVNKRRYSDGTIIRTHRRVLRMVSGYLSKMKLDTLHTDGRGLMTLRELKLHVDSALQMNRRGPTGSIKGKAGV